MRTRKGPWRPTSQKANLRKWARTLGLPNPPDGLSFLRLTRQYPTLRMAAERLNQSEQAEAVGEIRAAAARGRFLLRLSDQHKPLPTRDRGS